ncbi:hypothetical protein GCM10023405_32850 [Streptomonospora salina]
MRFSVTPDVYRMKLRPWVGFLLVGGIMMILAWVDGELVTGVALFCCFLAFGLVRTLWWVLVYSNHTFYMDSYEVVLTYRSKRRVISFADVSGIRYVATGQPDMHYGFGSIELELRNGKKVKHKAVVFKKESREKSDELNEVAPNLGFQYDGELFIGAGFWRKQPAAWPESGRVFGSMPPADVS